MLEPSPHPTIVGRREVGPEDVLGGLDGQFDYATATHSLNDNALWPPIAVAFQPHTTDFLMLVGRLQLAAADVLGKDVAAIALLR